MDRIRILPEKVANQIAAGEVVERPASVVRELLDNSIDAGSDKIEIKIEEGGRRLIRLKDNGIGMSKDDMLLSLERHATSKINSVADLFSVKSLGFRGEALPSIASVSRMEIVSRTNDQLVGYSLKTSGGKLGSMDETGAPVGTTVAVRDLFFNVPARRKFLKSVKTETDNIVDILSRIVLPFTRIQLRLIDGQRTLINLPASNNELNRLSVLLGRTVTESLIETSGEADGLKIRAYLGPHEMSRSRGDRIYAYINGRSIKDRMITKAVMEGYGQRLMKGRYPQVVVFMELDPSLVDVNVHPAKQEVRFHNSRSVYDTLAYTIEKSLKDQQFTTFVDLGFQKTEIKSVIDSVAQNISEPEWEYSEGEKHETEKIDFPSSEMQQTEYALKNSMNIIGQLRNTYILCQAKDGLIMLDQHAAHERIVYETLKKSHESSKIESQGFLIPQQFEFSIKDTRTVLKKIDKLAELGFDLEHFGGNTFLLRSVPSILVDIKWENFFLDLIPVMAEENDLSSERALDRLFTVMSCHSAIRAGQAMSHQEMIRLVEQLEKMELSTNCPHGRPIFKEFKFYEIEKMFKRIV